MMPLCSHTQVAPFYTFDRILVQTVPLFLFCLAYLLCERSMPAFGSSPCKAINDCDLFEPICASYNNEHQFFYSHCDMVREICLTGKNWRFDILSHCNVNKL